ncbi:unnamed protein product [Moneuplotes crassus]|uniref:Helicase C-terminal domain-containing protein n=2 Tax=Euplotes crassus TaxID=5936 RepID=A0AAD1Y5C2_EUPCR|nr:unnamed protein product [Moneuplotes crassus]
MKSSKRKSRFTNAPVEQPSVEYNPNLRPIEHKRDEILYSVDKNPCTIVCGDPSVGKSIQIPKFLHDAGFGRDRNRYILVSIINDVSCISLAKSIASNLHTYLGEQVGYSTKFESDFNEDKMCIKVVTDEVLFKEILIDPLLIKYEAVILTKRELCDHLTVDCPYNDILPGVLDKIQKGRKDLKLLISTNRALDVQKYSDIFTDPPPVIKVLHCKIPLSLRSMLPPVCVRYLSKISLFRFCPRIFYLEKPTYDYIEKAVETVYSIHQMSKSDGDIQVFFTGTQEVADFIQKFENYKATNRLGDDLFCVALNNNLGTEDLEEVMKPTPAYKRKVICSSLVAETSILVPDVTYTVDCCFEKYDNMIIPASKEVCEARAKLSSRIKHGKVFRLCEASYYDRILPDYSKPAIYRCDLSLLILRLKALGVKNIWDFKYLNQPDEEDLVKALEVLYSLGALTDEAGLTEDIGLKLAELPVDPKLGAAILNSNREEWRCTDEILSISALMAVGNIFQTTIDPMRIAKTKKKCGALEGDHITLINIFNLYTKKNKSSRKAFCGEMYLNERNLIKAVKIKLQLKEYLHIMGVKIAKSDDYDDPPAILKSLITGFFTNIAQVQLDGSYKNIRSGESMKIHPSSVLANIKPKWVLYNDIFVGTKKYMREVSEVDIDWVLELCPHFYKDTRKEVQQEKYKNESKLNSKRAKDLVKQDQRLKESQGMMKARSNMMKKPKGKFFSSKPKTNAVSGLLSKRVRRNDLAPAPKDVKVDPTKLDRMFPNKKAKRESSKLSFADDEDY